MLLLSKITSSWISGSSVQKASLDVHLCATVWGIGTQLMPYWPILSRNSFKKSTDTIAKDVPESGIRKVSIPGVLSWIFLDSSFVEFGFGTKTLLRVIAQFSGLAFVLTSAQMISALVLFAPANLATSYSPNINAFCLPEASLFNESRTKLYLYLHLIAHLT